MSFKIKYDGSTESNWYSNLVNANQTKEERKEKYWLLRSVGVSWQNAMAQRDWRLSKIERCYKEVLNGSISITNHCRKGKIVKRKR